MGLGVGGLSSLVVKHKMLINLIAGIIILILALDFLDIIKISVLQKNYSPRYSKTKNISSAIKFIHTWITVRAYMVTLY